MNQLEERLRNYAALTVAIGSAGALNAQVTYTDFDDVVISFQSMKQIDVNNDSILDFGIFVSGWSNSIFAYGGGYYSNVMAARHMHKIYPSNYAALYSTYLPASYGPRYYASMYDGILMQPEEQVDDSLSFGAGSIIIFSRYDEDILGQGDLYLPFKLNLDGNYHFGWMRVEVAEDGMEMIVKDAAIADEPDTPILTGQVE